MNTGSLKNMYWLVKREFWEHRGGFLWAPIITGGIFLLLNIMGIITAEVFGSSHGARIGGGSGLNLVINDMDAGDLSKVGLALDVAMYSAMGMVFIVMGFVVLFYCLGALYDDRRDRSILFWKSLPVSDLSTVLSKVLSATLLAPAIAIITGVLLGIAQLLLMALVLSFHGVNVWQLLTLAHPFRITLNMIGSLPLYALSALPSIGWLLFCSAWVRSKPFLWAVLLPVLAGVLMSWFGLMGLFNLGSGWFWNNVVRRLLLNVFPGVDAFASGEIGNWSSGQTLLNYHMLMRVDLWIGVLAGAALIAAAIWFRRWRDDS